MHEYYAVNKDKFKKGMDRFFSLVAPELEKASGKKYAEVFEESWDYYEKHLLERFPCQPICCPLIQRLRAERQIKVDARPVPVKAKPFQPSASALHSDARQST